MNVCVLPVSKKVHAKRNMTTTSGLQHSEWFLRELIPDDWWLVFYGHFCVHGRLNGPSGPPKVLNECKDETLIRYAHPEIQTQVVVICDPTRYG